MGRPPGETARDTRRAILDAALDLFADRGFHASSMRALASAVGVRESAIYHYFPSKTALLEAVLADHVEARAGEIEQELGRLIDAPLADLLTALTQRALVDLTSPRLRKIIRVMFTTAGEGGEDVAPLWRRLTDERKRVMGRVLGQLKKAGKVRDDVDIEVLHMHFMAPLLVASNALFADAPGGKGPLVMSMQRFVQRHVAFLVAALQPQPAPSTRAAARR